MSKHRREEEDSLWKSRQLEEKHAQGLLELPLDLVLGSFAFLDPGILRWVYSLLVCKKWAAQSRNARWLGLLRPVSTTLKSLEGMSSLLGLQYLTIAFKLENVEVLTCLTTLREIVIEDRYSFRNPLCVSSMSALINLETVDIQVCVIGLSVMCSGLLKLKSLQVKSGVDTETLRYLPTSLTMLRINQCQRLSCARVDMNRFHQLHTLCLRRMIDEDIKSLLCLKLASLSLMGSGWITIKGFHFLNYMTSLQVLDLSHTGISDLSVLSSLTLLEDLNLDSTKISDEGLQLNYFRSLHSLSLCRTKITNLDSVISLPNLTKLDITRIELSGRGRDSVSKLVQLKHLNFSGSNNGDKEIIDIPSLTRLQSLILAGCDLSDASVVSLSVLTNLSELDLGGCSRLTDISLYAISSLKLTRLVLGRCDSITDNGLLSLVALKKLEQLFICKQVSDQVKSAFRADVELYEH